MALSLWDTEGTAVLQLPDSGSQFERQVPEVHTGARSVPHTPFFLHSWRRGTQRKA